MFVFTRKMCVHEGGGWWISSWCVGGLKNVGGCLYTRFGMWAQCAKPFDMNASAALTKTRKSCKNLDWIFNR